MVAVIALVAAIAAAPPAVPPLAGAETIFERARDVWTNQVYPPVLQYVVTVRVSQRGVERANHYSARYAAVDGLIDVTAFSAEETAHPYVARGINVTFDVQGRHVWQLSRDPAPTDYLGVPILTPAYSFGVARRPAAFVAAPSTLESPLPTIGSVGTRQREYDLTLAGMEICDGVNAYHLVLRPLRDPTRNRLREMWVGATSYATLKLVTAGNFTTGPSIDVPWTIRFTSIGGVQYVSQESADAPLDFGGSRRYERAVISFEAISVPASRRGTILFRHPRRDGELREPGT
jgi:hypothetical protein